MELREFVRASLVDIIMAVREADAEAAKLGAIINPGHRSLPHGAKHLPRTTGLVPIQDIEFDVAVTASRAEGSEAKAGIEVVGISLGLGVKGKSESEAISVSRLRFSVPVVLPSERGHNTTAG